MPAGGRRASSRSRAGFSCRPRHAVEVVGHQEADEHHQHDGQGGARATPRAGVYVLLDQLGDHVRLRGTREQRRRVVVAEHRQHDDHTPREYSLGRERQRDAQEGLRRARPKVPRRLYDALVDPVERCEERQDQERHVTVDEAEYDGLVLAHEPLPWRVEGADEHEYLVDVAVRGEQIHPGQHPHQVVDPERGDDEEQQEYAVAAGVAGQVVGHGVADQQAQGGCRHDVDERAQEDDPELACEQLAEYVSERRRVPLQRIPYGQRIPEDGVRDPHGHREDRVEGGYEEDYQPDYAG